LGTCQQIWQALTDAAYDRKGLLVNLGGGVIGDMGGFCAATYKRGIAFAQVPTTLLAQVDASVGGKLGIDFMGFKNHIGVFCQPKLVAVCPAFLETLPPRELRSGFAEVLKHCLIRDRAWWERLRRARPDRLPEGLSWLDIVAHSIGVKDAVVAADPTERGLRKILNFGHTAGHAVETFFLQEGPKLLHGEAIAVGMVAEAYLSWRRGWISRPDLDAVAACLLGIYGKVRLEERRIGEMAALAVQDKKNEGGTVMAALLEGGIGQAGYDHALSMAELEESLRFYASL
jgi:3-dehydroquinate synthase